MGESGKQRYSLGEEIFSAVTHGAGSLLSVAGCVLLIVFSVLKSDAWAVVSTAIFGASLIILYTMSTLYHSITNIRAKQVFRILDHSTIFLLIAGTYTPYTLISLREFRSGMLGGISLGWLLFGIVWGVAIVGVILNAISIERFRKLSMVCYIAMGWAIVFAMKPLLETVPLGGIILLVGGGLLYTAGTVFYVMKRHKYFHSVWHLFVVAGSVLHFFSVLLFVI